MSALRWSRDRLPRIVWLTVVWVLLWGTFTLWTLVGGVAVAVVVTVLFPMRPAPQRLPVRPLRVLGLVGYLAYDLAVSTIGVTWQVLRHGPAARGAILEAPMVTSSDLVVTVMANAVSLAPGTAVLQIDPDRGVWYVYVLGPRDRAGVERARYRVLDMQRRVLAAFGSAAELAEVSQFGAGEAET